MAHTKETSGSLDSSSTQEAKSSACMELSNPAAALSCLNILILRGRGFTAKGLESQLWLKHDNVIASLYDLKNAGYVDCSNDKEDKDKIWSLNYQSDYNAFFIRLFDKVSFPSLNRPKSDEQKKQSENGDASKPSKTN